MEFQLTITIGFDEPAFRGFDVIGCLQRIREFIGQFVMPSFLLFFDPLPEDLRLTSHGLVATKPRVVEMAVLARQAPQGVSLGPSRLTPYAHRNAPLIVAGRADLSTASRSPRGRRCRSRNRHLEAAG
jgi:hypothetical protein